MNGSSRLSMVRLVHLFFGALGGMTRECRAVYKRLIQLLAEKRKEERSLVAAWVRRKISFALMKMIIVYIRGTRNTWEKDFGSRFGR